MSRVLLADDSADVRMLVRMCLHGTGHILDEVEDAQAALDRLAHQHYDLVLLDMEMPGMDGWECARQIRKQGGRWLTFPILALTGHTEPEDIQKCLDAGCSAHIAKPIRKDILVPSIERALAEAPNLPPLDPLGSIPGVSDSAMPSMGPAVSMGATMIDSDIADLVPGYLENRAKELISSRDALTRRDFAALKRTGHNLKGTGPTYGFAVLGKLGAKIESQAKTEDSDGLTASLVELEKILSELRPRS